MSSPNIEKTITSRQAFIFKDLKSPYFNPKWHFHPEFQMSYIIKGKGTRFIGDHVQTFKEGDLVLTPPNLPHLWRSEEAYFEKNNPLGTHAMVIYFDQELMSPPPPPPGGVLHPKETGRKCVERHRILRKHPARCVSAYARDSF